MLPHDDQNPAVFLEPASCIQVRLLALIDIVAAEPGLEQIPTKRIAAEVLARYVAQTRAFTAGDGAVHDLRQISMKGSPPLRAADALRVSGDRVGCRTIDETRHRLPDEYAHAVDVVEDTFVRYPIPLLQVVGSTLVPFLYEPDWPEQTSARSLRKTGRDVVRLLPGIADRLVVLGPLLRPLVELHWTRDVARWNSIAIEDERLRAHLFGASRTSFPRKLREALADMQGNACFYCGDRLAYRRDVDHFLAWSRWPNDAVENLVLADRCNSAKSDHLAAASHLGRWTDRMDRRAEDLAQLAVYARWVSDGARTRGLIVNTYAHVASGTPLWVHGSQFELATGPIHLDDVVG